MPPLLRRNHPTCSPAEPGTPTLKPGVLIRPNRALQRTGPLVTPGEIYHWSPLIDLGFGRLASDFQGLDGSLPPRSREPRLRPQGGHPTDPLYPTEGTRRSGRVGRLSCPPPTRPREPDARAEGAYSPAPLYPPRGTRRSGRGGLLTCTPLPASGNQTLGQRGPTHLHPSTRLGEPDARAEGAYSPAPLYPPRGTRRSGRGCLLTCTPLPG